jgi:hypothetical protein
VAGALSVAIASVSEETEGAVQSEIIAVYKMLYPDHDIVISPRDTVRKNAHPIYTLDQGFDIAEIGRLPLPDFMQGEVGPMTGYEVRSNDVACDQLASSCEHYIEMERVRTENIYCAAIQTAGRQGLSEEEDHPSPQKNEDA